MEEAASSLLALADTFLKASSIQESQFNVPKKLGSNLQYMNVGHYDDSNNDHRKEPMNHVIPQTLPHNPGFIDKMHITTQLSKWNNAPHVRIAYGIFFSKAMNRYADVPSNLHTYQMYPYLDPSQDSRTLKELSNTQILPSLIPKDLNQYSIKSTMPYGYSQHPFATQFYPPGFNGLWGGDQSLGKTPFEFTNRPQNQINTSLLLNDPNKENKVISSI